MMRNEPAEASGRAAAERPRAWAGSLIPAVPRAEGEPGPEGIIVGVGNAIGEALLICARIEYEFARLALGALGHGPESDGSIWWCTGLVSPVLVQGGTLCRAVPPKSLDALARVPGRALFRDAFSSLELASRGFVADSSETWMLRSAGEICAPSVEGLAISRATKPDEVALFERATYANADALDSYTPGSVHPAAATAVIAELHLLIGRLEGRPVATALAVEAEMATGIQAVTTHPTFRRRGMGGAMAAACCAIRPDRSTAISSTPGARSLYRSLGFAELAPATQWTRKVDLA